MRTFTMIMLCFMVFILSCLFFGARETVYVIAEIYVGWVVILFISLVVGDFLLRGEHNDVE